jgi:peptide/nickel transport system substrate-binding protein
MTKHTMTTRRTLLRAGTLAGIGGLAAPALILPREAQTQTRGGTLNTIINPEPPVLVLGVNFQGPTLIVGSKIYQGLLAFDFNLNPQPMLAKSFTKSPDGTTYTFNLQENVKWHDGRPFTADDVIFSITKFLMELSPRSRPVYQRITEASAPNPHTVVFKLNAPFEPFPLIFDVTNSPMVPKHLYDGTDYRNNPNNQTPVGTGPFRFQEWRRGNYIHLTRFQDYWKPGQPYLENIYYRIIPDSQSRATALQSGQVQMTTAGDIEPFDVPRFQQMANLNVDTRGWEMFAPLSWIEMNNRHEQLKDARVRRALAMALDRDFIVQRLWFGVGKPATSPIASATRFHDPSVRLPAYNPREAMQLLDAAGLRAGAGGVRTRLKFLNLPYGEVWTRLGEYIRQAFAQIGVQLEMESTDAGGWVRRLGQWEYELTPNFVFQYGDPTLGVQRTYISSNIQRVPFSNTAGYSNPRVDELFARAASAAETEQRRAAFSEAQKILAEDMPLLWLLELRFPTIHDRRVRNVITGGTGVHFPYDDVSIG